MKFCKVVFYFGSANKGGKGTCASQPVTGGDAPTSCELRRSRAGTLPMGLEQELLPWLGELGELGPATAHDF